MLQQCFILHFFCDHSGEAATDVAAVFQNRFISQVPLSLHWHVANLIRPA